MQKSLARHDNNPKEKIHNKSQYTLENTREKVIRQAAENLKKICNVTDINKWIQKEEHYVIGIYLEQMTQG